MESPRDCLPTFSRRPLCTKTSPMLFPLCLSKHNCSIPHLPRPQLPLRTTQANTFMKSKWTQCACLLSCVWHFAILWTVAHQAPLFMEFFRQEYWSELPFSCSRGSFQPRDRTQVSCISGIACGFLTRWAIPEAHMNTNNWMRVSKNSMNYLHLIKRLVKILSITRTNCI